jgi:hypothetical protein
MAIMMMIAIMMVSICTSGHFIPSFNYFQPPQKSLLSKPLQTTISETYSFHGADFLIHWADFYSLLNINIATEMWKYDLCMVHREKNLVCYKLLVTQLLGQHIYTCCSFVFDFFDEIRYETNLFIKSASTTYYLLL